MIKFSWSEPPDNVLSDWQTSSQPLVFVHRRSGARGIYWPIGWGWRKRLVWRLLHWEWAHGS